MSTTPVTNPGYYADFRGLDSLKKSAREHDPKAVRQAARQFESLLTSMLLKSMRQAKLGDGLGDSQETEFYQDMLDQQVAVQLSQGKGLGLADMLVQQLTRSGLASAGDPAKAKPVSNVAAAAPVAPSPAAAATTAPAQVLDRAAPVTCPGVPMPLLAPAVPETPTMPAAEIAPALVPLARTPSSGPVPLPEQAAFVRQLAPFAQRAAERLGIAPEALIAHAALETGWGRHVPAAATGGSSFNLFGIKASGAWNGPSVAAQTVEYDAGIPATVEQPFRAYASLEQALNDYVNVLQGSARFKSAIGTGRDTGAFANGLARGGYATDPAYGSKLAAVADRVRVLRAGIAFEPTRVADTPADRAASTAADTRLAT